MGQKKRTDMAQENCSRVASLLAAGERRSCQYWVAWWRARSMASRGEYSVSATSASSTEGTLSGNTWGLKGFQYEIKIALESRFVNSWLFCEREQIGEEVPQISREVRSLKHC